MPEERSVLITGGEGSLAQALSAAFVRAGYRVLSPGRNELDVTKSECVRQYFSRLSSLAVLVNNAGCIRDSSASRMTLEDWSEVMDVNLRGAFLCCQAAAPLLHGASDAHVINIGSYSGKFGPFGQANYASAKAGLVGFSASLAREWGSSGIRVNTVLPGFLETRMTADLGEPVKAAALAAHVLGRFNTIHDAARFVVFIDGMKHVSGQTFQLDSRL